MREIAARLFDSGIEGADFDARKLAEHFSGDELENAIKRRMAREPMSHILGYRDFWRDRFIVTKDVLDPRPDSELFIELALEGEPPKHILDLGCGSGALGLSALREFPDADCVFVDISQAALNIAEKNAKQLGFDHRSRFIKSDWFSNVAGEFNLVLCNPPYITEDEMQNLSPEVCLEPPLALTPGGDGLASYHIISKNLRAFLSQNGAAYFEHGFQQQGEVISIFKNMGFEAAGQIDINKKPRIVKVTYKN